jgi:hypothetical protein
MNKSIKAAAIFFSFLLPFGTALAMNFGSAARQETATVHAFEPAIFNIIFWNSGNEAEMISLSSPNLPKGWTIQFEKNNFLINNTLGNELIQMPGGALRATSDVIQINSNGSAGTYHVLITAKSSINGSDMSLGQERIFNLTVIVTGNNMSSDSGEILPGQSKEAVFFAPLIVIAIALIYVFSRKKKLTGAFA